MSFLLTGQTDSGKSTICGHLLYQVGYFSQLSEDDAKYYRTHLANVESSDSKSKYSLLMDLLDGEITTNKTKTQEFNICPFTHQGKSFTLIDTPGHKLYIRSLIDGLFHLQLDCICLVVSSIHKEFTESFERGTVKEDLLLSRSIGCKNLIVIWNKIDQVNPTESMKENLDRYLTQLAFSNVKHVSLSGFRGDGLLQLLDSIDQCRSQQQQRIVANHFTSDNSAPVSSSSSSSSEEKVSANSSSQIYTLDCLFFIKELPIDPPVLVSVGYQCVAHCAAGGELMMEIAEITEKRRGNKVIVAKDSKPVVVLAHFDKKVQLSKGERLIFRDKDQTIGFGVIIVQATTPASANVPTRTDKTQIKHAKIKI